MVTCSKHTQVLTHLVHSCHGSLLPSTVFNVLALVNIILIHASRGALSISAKPGSATHFSTSIASAGLQRLLVGACVHLVMFRAVSCRMWLVPCINVSHASHMYRCTRNFIIDARLYRGIFLLSKYVIIVNWSSSKLDILNSQFIPLLGIY